MKVVVVVDSKAGVKEVFRGNFEVYTSNLYGPDTLYVKDKKTSDITATFRTWEYWVIEN